MAALYQCPRFPLKGSFKGDTDADMDIDSDLAASIMFGGRLGLLSRGLGLI